VAASDDEPTAARGDEDDQRAHLLLGQAVIRERPPAGCKVGISADPSRDELLEGGSADSIGIANLVHAIGDAPEHAEPFERDQRRRYLILGDALLDEDVTITREMERSEATPGHRTESPLWEWCHTHATETITLSSLYTKA
jgi:hypothetical protein